MRIIAGTAKGRKLKAPAGRRVRPTSDKVREALFSILGDMSGAQVLDLFTGTGALGLEAVSRGADKAVLVDRDVRVLKVTEQNVQSVGFGDQVEIRRADLTSPSAASSFGPGPFDVIFCDPPYGFPDLDRVLDSVRDVLATEGLLVVEHDDSDQIQPPDGLQVHDRRVWGGTAVTFLRREE